MSLLVGLILTALNGPVGTESRGVASFTNFDIAPLKIIYIGKNKVSGGKPKFHTQMSTLVQAAPVA